jgi:hypothetical protein
MKATARRRTGAGDAAPADEGVTALSADVKHVAAVAEDAPRPTEDANVPKVSGGLPTLV